MRVMKSSMDKSINFVEDKDIGFIESRFVRRGDEYFIVYISSQTGCDMACRMCHLTATGQNKLIDVPVEDIFKQAEVVLSHYDKEESNPAEKVHFNFMARGEPLNAKPVIENGDRVVRGLHQMAFDRGLDAKTLISTIMPYTLKDKSLLDIFPNERPLFYYSIYSVNPDFRKKWLRRALEPELALAKLKEWQDVTGEVPKIHFAFIKNENDTQKDAEEICKMIEKYQLKVNMNVVRYNPYSEKYGEEADEEVIQRRVKFFEDNLYNVETVSVIPKVGFDVKASCGMFIK